jgi:Tfp pilus assembly protein PilO
VVNFDSLKKQEEQMERPDRNEKDDAQKAKLIFISLAVAVVFVLGWSLMSANSARKERDAVRQELELVKQDNAKLEQMLREQSVVLDDLKKKAAALEAKAKAKPVAKKKATATKSTAKKTAPSKKRR